VPVALPDGDRQPVIFCTWHRLERLPRTLEMLAVQDVPVQALIWDNSGRPELVAKAAAEARIPVAVHHSGRNIGGFGRFYVARECALAGHEKVVFIDDDQDFGPEAVRELLAGCRPGTLASQWALRFPGSFAERRPVHPGETPDYTGTGGMAADTAVFRDPRLFGCPRRFWFAEDIWLSWHATVRCGYVITHAPVRMHVTEDEHAQWSRLGYVKDHLVRYLIRRGYLAR
jgi:hypothetical protein